MSTELAPGAVTTADLYRELVGLRTDITRTLERLAVIDSRNRGADQIDTDHETRLRALEAFKWKLIGAAIVVGAGAGGAASWIALAVTHR
jgi:hypothetical protein